MSEESKVDPSADLLDRLFIEFENYLIHGGFLTAINDIAQHQQILPATLATYSDWIRGDVLKRNKRENYLLEIVGDIISRYGSQLSWNALAGDLSIDHPKTVVDHRISEWADPDPVRGKGGNPGTADRTAAVGAFHIRTAAVTTLTKIVFRD